MTLKRLFAAITALFFVFAPLAAPVEALFEAPSDALKPASLIVQYKGQAGPTEAPLPAGESLSEALRRYAADPAVAYAEPDQAYHASILPNDPNVTSQWYLRRVRAADAWTIRSSSEQVVIAVIDSGVQINHPDLHDNIWVNAAEIPGNGKDDDKNGFIDDRYGWDFVNGVPDPSPKFSPGFTEAGILHGTIVAGIAAARGDNEQGIAGISWDARIMALKALDDQGDGSTATVVRAIDYAIAKGANIINLSFVGFGYSRSLRDALERAYNAGVIVVAPAGNEQSDGSGTNLNIKPIYPACYRNAQNRPLVVGVAATDGVDQKASFSGYGDSCISLAAPGVSFYSTSVYSPLRSVDGKFFTKYYDGYWSGTSVAVPLVSGTLALIEAANPTLSARAAVDVLLQTTDSIDSLNPEYEKQLGSGRLNVFQAVSAATDGTRKTVPQFVFAPNAKGAPLITITDSQNLKLRDFYAFPPSFTGGLSIATGDTDGDGYDEIIAAPASGKESEVKVFDRYGVFKSHFLAYPATFRGGLTVSASDINGDGKAEIITAPKAGIRSDIKIFSAQGKLLKSFLAYPENFRGGATAAVGDVMGDSAPEIVTGTGIGGVPQVKIFSTTGAKLGDFIVDKGRTPSGLNILLFDIDGNARRLQSEIIVTRQSGPARLGVFDFRGNLRSSWQPYNTKFRGGIKAVATDLDADGLKEILTAPLSGGGPHVRIFDRFGHPRSSFYAYAPAFDGGVNFAVLSIKR